MINSKSKRIGIVLVGVLIVILVFVGIGENKMQSVKSVKKYIIKSNKIQSVQILDKTGNIIQEIDNEARIKRLTDILNRSVHDDDMNDGRMVKMKVAERTIKIIFRDESKIYVQLWDNLMRINQIWYRLDTKQLEETLR
ncbi:hypothetical protein [Bulleidia extructa]